MFNKHQLIPKINATVQRKVHYKLTQFTIHTSHQQCINKTKIDIINQPLHTMNIQIIN